MQYQPGTADVAPGLFVYSRKSGEFEFFYLDEEGDWVSNPYMPRGKADHRKESQLQYVTAKANMTAYIVSTSLDGREIMILEVNDDKWVANNYFPKKLPK